MKTFLSLLLIVHALNASSQCNPSSTIKDPLSPDPCRADRIQRPFPVGYAALREADVMWSKRIWRVIDLKEKLNMPMYYPVQPKVCLMSLFDVLKCAVLENDLQAFANPVFDDEFTAPMTKKEVMDLLVSWDSTHLSEDINNPGNMVVTPLKTEINSEEITQYWIKEDWFFDKERVRVNKQYITKQKIISTALQQLSQSVFKTFT